jgi:hypothetical protein
MTRALLILGRGDDRQKAIRWCGMMKDGVRIEFKDAKRTIPQNDRMWAMLTDVATQLKWHGVKLSPDDWKLIFLDSLKREVRAAPNIDGTGFVNLGRSSSDLSVEEMRDLIELIFAFGANHGVVFQDTETKYNDRN